MFSFLSCTTFDPFLLRFKWNNTPDGNSSPFLLLQYHLDRLLDAAQKHRCTTAYALEFQSLKSKCEQAVREYDGPDSTNAFKLRLTLALSGELTVIVSPINSLSTDPTSASFFNPRTDNPSLFGPVLTAYIDPQPTETSLFTSTKTTRRSQYDDARNRAGIPPLGPGPPPCADVLLFNSQNHLMEASMFNVALYRSSEWFTPPASTGCLPGVLRRWLLEQGRIKEAKEGLLTRASIQEGDWVLFMNGVFGCQLGKVTSHATQ